MSSTSGRSPRSFRAGVVFPADHFREIDNAFRETPYDWSRFFSELDSRGYVEVSAVGFDRDKTKAVTYSAVHCGGTCGKGVHTAWEKRNGKWIRRFPS
jgi:hypothetical protein